MKNDVLLFILCLVCMLGVTSACAEKGTGNGEDTISTDSIDMDSSADSQTGTVSDTTPDIDSETDTVVGADSTSTGDEGDSVTDTTADSSTGAGSDSETGLPTDTTDTTIGSVDTVHDSSDADSSGEDTGSAGADTETSFDTDSHPDDDTGDEIPDDTDTTFQVSKGAMGMGLGGISDWSTQYPFINFMKHARSWHDWDNDDNDDFDLDENGWVRSLQPGQTAGSVFLVKEDGSPVVYDTMIVYYEGTGTIEYTWSASKIENASTPGRDVVSVGEGNHLMKITATDSSDPIRNIAIVPAQYEENYLNGEIFNPDFLDRIKHFRAVRFMDWMQTNDSTQSDWTDRPRVSDPVWTRAGVPLEIMIQLANKLGASPWFCIPHLADETYIREFATMVKHNLDPALTAYVEHSNEVWNWQFEQAQYANTTGRERWGDEGNAYMQWHGMRTATICDIWKDEVFQDDAERVHCVLGTQAGWQGLEEGALECPLWVDEQAGREPCHAHGIDSLSITGYFSACLHSEDHEATIRSWFDDPDGGMGRAMSQIENAGEFPCDNSVAGLADTYRYFKDVADSYGLAITAYEGGQHITANAHSMQDDEDFINFHIAVNRDSGMKDRYLENFNNWKNEGGTLFMHFVDFGTPSKWGSWGALEHLFQESSPKWDAITEFNDQLCWWEGC